MTVSKSSPSQIGIAWLGKDDYCTFRLLLTDLPFMYETWQRQAKKRLTHITRDGYQVVKVEVSPEELVTWCRRHHREVNWLSLQIFVDARVHSETSGRIDSPT
ncbi:hypothetical protein WK68_24915 [Burkholderia ubonensis]|uniref:hypothetical protein n=1 Tax=Burkholderia ubonensis TaxID=101571 RepID=UPI000751B4D0|nr:hypothetical protein [Burkholderia ubonensis]KVU55587.1 hypothetical protein WK68_24915 [Burkholderia ubonensis]